jgi:hypothetical protein
VTETKVEGRELILTGISSSWLSADSVEVVGRSCGGYSLSEQSCSGYRFFFFFLKDLGLSAWKIWGLPAISGGDGWLLSVDLSFRRFGSQRVRRSASCGVDGD